MQATRDVMGGYSMMSPSAGASPSLAKRRTMPKPRASSALKFSPNDAKRLGFEPSKDINRKAQEK